MGRLAGKVAVITGAANGIGAAAARRFVQEGARVVLVDLDVAALNRLAAEFGPDAACVVGNVAEDATSPAYVTAALERWGRLDVALLNAGIEGAVASIPDLPMATFDQVWAVNVRSVWLGLAAVMPAMKAAGGGSVVITSSTAGLRGSARMAAYATSKHAVVGLMRSAALEGAPDSIRVNCVNPGPTDTRMIAAIDAAMTPGTEAAPRLDRIPLRRYGKVEDIAAVMLFLASDEAGFTTGATYVADGGFLSGSAG
jgi:NAD(P)-dependent dehydrogenase (short-subunit alcohol dehydrogenase family)